MNQTQETTPGELDFTSCPEWGKGGQFVVDPKTGLRVRVQPDDGAAPAEVMQEAEAKKSVNKEKNRG